MKETCKCKIGSKITVENEYGEYSVSVKCSDLVAHEFIIDLVRPLMLAVGYAEHTVQSVLGEYNEGV